MHQYILSIDVGTQSVRVALVDFTGDIVACSKVPIEPCFFAYEEELVEIEPDYYWKCVGEACQELWNMTTIQPSSIAGVGLTTQRNTVVNLDNKGVPLRPAILWLDQRRTKIKKWIGGYWGALFTLLGIRGVVSGFQEKAQSAWIAEHQPDIWHATSKFILLSGYLTFKLTGEYKDSIGCIVGYMPFDYKRQTWARKNDWRWKVVQVAPHMLSTLVYPGSKLGYITENASRHTAIPAGTPCIATASDKACEIIGSGGDAPHIACMSFGTTATMNTTNKKYIEPFRFIPPYPAAIPHEYNVEIMVYRGFWLVQWFKEQFGEIETKIAKEQGIAPETLFDRLLEKTSPGSMGLILQPHWSPEIRYQEPETKGAIIGFGNVHTRAHIYRSIIEGICYELRKGKEIIEKRSGVPITIIRASGGGSQSDAVVQISADILGMPIELTHTHETSILGAAINVAVGLGHYNDHHTAISNMTRVKRVFTPNKKANAIYNSLYKHVYLKMYRRLQPLYKTIQGITQYPKIWF